ncbi:hypothetical protein EFT87_03900 [Schleiferilactobacillus harbinensis]|uniref:phage holin family protein n=1 Tax=Schleiferilactobacillus harbinensis TaxID=304207 RepID=UPI0021A80E8C|nr:phage holin family protein [Schleiferilactobacillus harbinensis]MCT2907804.1 hypothetical protein [Schleiferilactobacillus harbinensis]
MNLIEELNLGTAAELAISAAIIFALVQAIKQTKVNNKWLPWIAMALGVVAGLVSVVVTKDSNWGPAAVQGFLLGAATSGLFDGVKSFTYTPVVSDPVPAEPVQANPQGALKPDVEAVKTIPDTTGGETNGGQH